MESKIIDVKEIDYLKKEYNYHITLERFSKKIDELIEYEKAQKIDDNSLEKNLKNIIGEDENKPTLFHYLCYYACCITITKIYNLFSDKSKFTSLLNRNDRKKMTPIIYVIIGHYASNTDETLINKRIELINFLCSIDIGIINKTDNNDYIAIDYCFEGLLFNEKYLRYFEVNLNEDNLRKNTDGAIKMVTENFITSTQYMYKIFECLLSKYDVSEFTSFLSKFEKIYDSKNEYDNTIIEGIKFDFKNCKIYNKVVDKLKELKKKAEEESEKNAQELEEDEEKESKKKEGTKSDKKKNKKKNKKKELAEEEGKKKKLAEEEGKKKNIKNIKELTEEELEKELKIAEEELAEEWKKKNIKELIDVLIDEIEVEIFKKTTYYKDTDTKSSADFFSASKLIKNKNKNNELTSLVENTEELLKSLIETSKQLEKLIDDTKLKELEKLIEKKKQLEKLIDDTELKEQEKKIEKKLEELKLKKEIEIEKLIETKINSITGLKNNIIELKKKNADSGKSITKISFTRRKSAKLKSLKIKRRKSVKLKSLKRRKSVKLKSSKIKRRKSVKSKSLKRKY